MAVSVTSVTSIIQKATFLNGFKANVFLTESSLVREKKPSELIPPRFATIKPPPGKPAYKEDAATAAILKEAEDLWGYAWFGGLEGSASDRLDAVGKVRERLAERLRESEKRIDAMICAPIGHPVLDAWIGDILLPSGPNQAAPGAKPSVCAKFREALALEPCSHESGCRWDAMRDLAEETARLRRGPIDIARWHRLNEEKASPLDMYWFWQRTSNLVPVTGRPEVTSSEKASARKEIEGRLPPSLRGLSESKIRAQVLAPASDLRDQDWVLFLMLWSLSGPQPTIEMASKVLDFDCRAERCGLAIINLEIFRSRRLRQAVLAMQTLSQLDAPKGTASCTATKWPEGLESSQGRRSPLRSHIILRQAEDRLRAAEPELRSADANAREALVLELCLVGTIAFWVVAGLLAGWAELEGPRKEPTVET